MVSLSYFAPAEEIRDMVSVGYLFDAPQPHFADAERSAIAQVRIVFSGNATLTFADGKVNLCDDLMIVGPSTGATHFEIEGPFRMFGFGLLPCGWTATTAKSAAEYVDRIVPVSDLFDGALVAELERLKTLETGEAIMSGINNIFAARKHLVPENDQKLAQIVDDWLASSPSPAVADLMARCTCSSRQVLRNVNRLYGMPPKYLARKYRALRAARAMAEHNEAELLALEDSFYDQSHMIREIKFFAGTTPHRLRVDEGELASLIDQRGLLKGYIAPLTSET
ncbi:MAG: helix-turn-helix domain-containing protein [Parasphingorhabdus sp.]|nr:helix-turn-helix domain-containing protein [Parasphingorhabdus sp.]